MMAVESAHIMFDLPFHVKRRSAGRLSVSRETVSDSETVLKTEAWPCKRSHGTRRTLELGERFT